MTDTCPTHGCKLTLVFDHVAGLSYKYCPRCQPPPQVHPVRKSS